MATKILPQVSDMELELIGIMLLKHGEAIPTIAAILRAEDFFREEHKILFDTIMSLYVRKITPSILSLYEELRRRNDLDKVGESLVLSLNEVAFTTAFAESYATKIKEKSLLRQLIKAGEEIVTDAYEDTKPVEEILDGAERKIFRVTSKNSGAEMEVIEPILQRAFEKIQLAVDNKGQPTGISSGYLDFDKSTSGFQKSDLILLAARPSMGKTAFALNIAMNAADVSKGKKTVAVFSLEMSKEQLGQRLLSSQSGINSMKLSTGNLEPNEISELAKTIDRMADWKLFIDDTAGISVLELRSKARRLMNEYGLDLIIIDYLQLMQGRVTRNSDGNRQQEISEISRSLKALARELNVPIIALSQLSRGVELRADKRPLLSDLRESGSLEQDADIVMFIYREEYYNQETDNANIAEIIIAKNRNGPTSSIKLQFDKACMKFQNLTSAEE